jgi:hypothetical protein
VCAPESGVGIAAFTIAAVDAPEDDAEDVNAVRDANEFESAIAFAAAVDEEGEKLGREKLTAEDGIAGGLRRPATMPGVCDGIAPAPPFEAEPDPDDAAAFSEWKPPSAAPHKRCVNMFTASVSSTKPLSAGESSDTREEISSRREPRRKRGTERRSSS